jgi:cytoskeleton protein RodZ
MSLTLGEKLRQAREERGISLSEVAEQTRISGHYLDAIEHDDYSTLPGGIFNKGFVKSFAKCVELDEQEALQDYSSLIAANESQDDSQLKVYRPEVLTDDRSGGSMIPTIIIAVVILGLMTAGILFLVDYIRNRPSTPVVNTPVANANANTVPANANTAAITGAPDMATLKVEFKALSEPVSLSATSDGKMSTNVVTPGTTSTFEPKESLKLSYSKSLAALVLLTINGKAIALPAKPLNEKRAAIEFEINKDNIGQIWQSGAISTDVPAAVTDVNANVSGVPGGTGIATPRPTTVPKPSVAANTASANSPASNPGETPKSSATPKPLPSRPAAANRPQ